MALIHGKNGFVSITLATTTYNITGDGNNCSLTDSENHPESTAYGTNNVSRSPSSLGDNKFTYEGWASTDAASGTLEVLSGSLLKGNMVTITFGPGGSGTGAIKYSACMVRDDGEVTAPVDNLVKARASFSLGSGSLTKGVF